MWKEYPKIYLTKLKTTSVYEKLVNNWFFIAFLIMLWLITLNHWWMIFALIICCYIYFKKLKILVVVTICSIAIITIIYGLFSWRYQYNIMNEAKGVVIEIQNKENCQQIKIRDFDRLFIIYDDQYVNVKIGDKIVVSGEGLATDGARIPNGFDYRSYLYHKKIVGRIIAKDIIIDGHRFCLPMMTKFLKEQVKSHLDDESSAFILTVILGDDEGMEESFSQAIKDNGIIHLFAISGLHISLFIRMLTTALTFLKISEDKQIVFLSLFLGCYLIVTSFSPSVFRAVIMWVFTMINKKGKLRLSSLDILCLSFILLIVINPFYMYDLGFQLSFLATLIIIIGGPLVENRTLIMKIFALSLLCLLFTLPIVININYQINLFSPFTNVVFILLFETIMLPAAIIVFFLPWLSFLFKPMMVSFKSLNLFFYQHFCLFLKLPKMGIVETALFYIILFYVIYLFFHFKPQKVLAATLLVLMLFSIKLLQVLQPTSIYFLDLLGGEATVIIAPKEECYAVIDTGTGKQSDVTQFLKSKGVTSLDLLILTHNHSDHNGETPTLLQEFKVHNLITSKFDQSIFRNDAIKVQANDQFNCGKIVFKVLSPSKDDDNPNNDSLVLKATIGDMRFLWMGDAEKEVESQLMNSSIEADVIKIGHHGSSTSSTLPFIQKVNPKHAVIQTERLTNMGFPSKQTIANLDLLGTKTWRTDWHYSIVFTFRFKKWHISSLKTKSL
ncbi:MAG: DNA internalization-related competence protein ComEC/Rec2 [Bacilli bacterium]